MKKLMILTIAVSIALVTLFTASQAFAQSPTPTPPTQTAPFGFGKMGYGRMGRGLRNGAFGGMMGWFGQGGNYSPLHEYMIDALAEQLNLKADELESRITAGETPYQIALSTGLTDTQIGELFQKAHTEALKAAVAGGVINQEMADWMSQRMTQRWQNGFPGAGGCMGRWGGQRWSATATPQPTN